MPHGFPDLNKFKFQEVAKDNIINQWEVKCFFTLAISITDVKTDIVLRKADKTADSSVHCRILLCN